MLSTYVQYNLIAANMDRSVEAINRDPVVSRETEYYLANIGNIDTVEDFIADTRLFNYAMKAHGLSDMSYAKAFMTKIREKARTKVWTAATPKAQVSPAHDQREPR